MVDFMLNEGVAFKKIFDVIASKDLIQDATWECTEKGMELQQMSKDHVVLVSIKLKGDAFDKFTCKRPFNLSMHFLTAARILNCIHPKDRIRLKAEETDRVAMFSFESKNEHRVADYEMQLVNLNMDHLGIPEMEYDALVIMPSEEWRKVLRDLGMFGDTVTITCTKAGMGFHASGDLGKATINISQCGKVEEPRIGLEILLNNPVWMNFSLRYLNIIASASTISRDVIISLTKDQPICIEYKIDVKPSDEVIKTEKESTEDVTIERNLGFVRFYLAPKIVEED